MSSRSGKLYINTMVFSIIAGIISLMLLLLLFYGASAVEAYTPLIVTVEIGMLIVIITAVVRIYLNERKAKKALDDMENKTIVVTTCPDYWVMSRDEDSEKTVCSNRFTGSRGPLSPTFVMPLADATNTTGTINLEDYDGHTLKTVCGKLKDLGAPWTEVRAECDAYNV